MRIKWTVRNGVLGTCRMSRTGDLRDFRPAQEVPIPVDAPDWEVFGAECHGSPKNVARFLGKETLRTTKTPGGLVREVEASLAGEPVTFRIWIPVVESCTKQTELDAAITKMGAWRDSIQRMVCKLSDQEFEDLVRPTHREIGRCLSPSKARRICSLIQLFERAQDELKKAHPIESQETWQPGRNQPHMKSRMERISVARRQRAFANPRAQEAFRAFVLGLNPVELDAYTAQAPWYAAEVLFSCKDEEP